MNPALQTLSLHLLFFTGITLIFRLRQTRLSYDFLGIAYRIAMASFILACLEKGWSRIDDGIVTLVDVWMEFSIMLAIAIKVVVGWRDGRK